MTGTYRFDGHLGRSGWSAPVLGLVAAALLGCGGLLDVENPNNIKDEDVTNPVAGASLSNGAQRQVSFGVTSVLLPYATAADELDWVGSRDAWRELEQGKLSNGYNEFTDAAFPPMAQGRWLADEAIKILESQQTAGTLADPLDLAESYLWGATAYVSIADAFDDWALSDRRTAAPPVGPANMGSFYDTAIGYLTKGLAIAQGRSASLALAIRAMRARTSFSRAIWDLVGVKPIKTGLVSATSTYTTNAVADANAVLAAVPSADWSYRFTYSVATGTSDPGGWVNQRQEMRIGRVFAAVEGTNKWGNTVLMDPIDTSKPSAVVDAVQKEWRTRYPSHTIVSARELHLIIAEAELAQSDLADFEDAINDLRGLDGLTDWDRSAPQVPALNLLIYSRQANLFLQGRRLSDHYRFQVPPADWLAGSEALTSPGTFLPITAIECLSNPNIGSQNCST